MRSNMSFESCRSMVRLYCSAYCDLRWGANSPKSSAGRNVDQSTHPFGPAGSKQGVLGVWVITLPALLGFTMPVCKMNGVLNRGADRETLVPKGGSALNCCKTSSSIGL